MKSIYGGNNFWKPSKEMIIDKSMDTLEKAEPRGIRNFQKPAQEVKEIKIEWGKHVKLQQAEAYTAKQRSCIKDESTMYELLEKL